MGNPKVISPSLIVLHANQQQNSSPPFSSAVELPRGSYLNSATNVLSLQDTALSSPIQPPETAPGSGALQTLPVVYRQTGSGRTILVKDDVRAYLKHDLDISRLNEIHEYLWLAGLLTSARPLHRQLCIDRNIVATEQADLHLLWNGNKIFVKPLPLYLLDYGFWETYLCTSEEVYRVTCGFVLSYIWLINSELDHRFAFDFKLLPPQATWPW
jgi:hypothetical protein